MMRGTKNRGYFGEWGRTVWSEMMICLDLMTPPNGSVSVSLLLLLELGYNPNFTPFVHCCHDAVFRRPEKGG